MPRQMTTTADAPRRRRRPRVLVLFGSSRSRGNTRLALRAFLNGRRATLVDLTSRNVGYYDYEHRNAGDDFIELATSMVLADLVVFATPVYWYAMSAVLKTFFDRLTDLLQIRKDLGRALRGKRCFVLATGSDPQLSPGFKVPFALTCRYFEMRLLGVSYHAFDTPLVMSRRARNDARRAGARLFAQWVGGSRS